MLAALDIHLRGLVVIIEGQYLFELAHGVVPFLLPVFHQPGLEMAQGIDHLRIAFLGVVVENLMDGDRLGLPLYHHQIKLTAEIGRLQGLVGEFADQDVRAILLAGRLQAG